MRRLLPVLIPALVCWFPAGAAGQALTGDSVTGSGTTNLLAFSLDAHSGPAGENASGYAREGLILSPVIEVKGPVTCLNVSGNRAVIGIENSGYTGGPLRRGALIAVFDGGTSEPDRITSPSLLDEPPTTCPAAPLGFEETVISGDIVVHDTPPFPTAKDQCKNGGWRDFGVFNNQGDCVSYVATKGKNPPAGH